MDLKTIQPALETQLSLLGFELVLLESAREGKDEILRLYVDHLAHDKPITLDDCATLNEGLMVWMDVEFPHLRETFGVEISSPGIERPLVTHQHFVRYFGHLCKVQTRQPVNGQKRFKGWINASTDTSVTIEEDGVLKHIPFDLIQKARLAPFDEDSTPKPKHTAKVVDESVGAEKSVSTGGIDGPRK
ncbi:MAG: ribosome maturation factor RimP [Holophagaceae bacterium]|nr:ribosome maturation factor RimP [Holophagaceae bacterium]